MSKYITLFLVLAFATTAFSASRRVNANTRTADANLKWWTESTAITYTSKSFETNVGKENFMIIQFCATFSKDCEALAPEYNKLAEMYTGANAKRSDVIVAKIDGWTFNSLSQTYSVKKFPTIRLFNKGDPTNSDEYSGEFTANKMSEWMEGLIKEKSGSTSEPQKAEEPQKQEAVHHEESNTNTQATNTQAAETPNTATQQEQPKQAEPVKAAEGEDLKKDFKLVLNTTLLQGQFDEVQKQLNALKEHLEKSITENFKKVETLGHNLESHKNEFRNVLNALDKHGDKIGQLSTTLNSHKDDIKGHVSSHSENHFSGLKDAVNTIKGKVFEPKVEEAKGPGFMHNLIYIVLGGVIGGVAVHFLGGGNGKKRRSMLD